MHGYSAIKSTFTFKATVESMHRCIFCSYGSYVSKGKEFSELYVTMTGLLMIAAQCTVSGMASVYAEYILKKQQEVTYFHVLPMSASLLFAY